MKADCAKFASHCFECQLSKGKACGSWGGQLLSLPPGPRVVWACDLITNLGPPGGPAYHVLCMIDCYSKFCLLSLLSDKTSKSVAMVLHMRLFTVFGPPAALRSDNGTEFKGAVSALCQTYGTKQHFTSPYTSHSNGQVERLNRTVEDLIRRPMVTMPPDTWHYMLPDVQLAINTTYAKSIGCPPYLVMFGSTPPSQAFDHIPDPTVASLSQYTAALKRQLTVIQAAATSTHSKYR